VSRLDYVAHLRRETDSFVAAAEGNFDKPVPSCPGWTVRDLVEHMWGVYAWWGLVAERKLQDPSEVAEDDEPDTPPDEKLLDEIKSEVEHLIEAVERADPREPVWSWSVNKTMSFIPRRMANEVSIHRWDCESATGTPTPIDDVLAEDGVHEFVDIWFPSAIADAEQPAMGGDGSSVRLRSTEGSTWDLILGGEGVEATEEAERPVATVSASASDLVLLLWRRIAPDDVRIEGDRAAVAKLLGWLDLT
jgi:uncharacterized protein (TIGR03083 family)